MNRVLVFSIFAFFEKSYICDQLFDCYYSDGNSSRTLIHAMEKFLVIKNHLGFLVKLRFVWLMLMYSVLRFGRSRIAIQLKVIPEFNLFELIYFIRKLIYPCSLCSTESNHF